MKKPAKKKANPGDSSSKFIDEPQQRLVHQPVPAHSILTGNHSTTLTERYLELYEYSPAAYFTLTQEGVIEELNQAAAFLLGREKVNLVSQVFSSLIAVEHHTRFGIFFQDLFTAGVKSSCRLLLNSDRNTRHNVHIDGVVMSSGSRCQLVVTDITEWQVPGTTGPGLVPKKVVSNKPGAVTDKSVGANAAQQVVAEKAMSDSILNHLPGSYYLQDEQGRLIWWNENFEKISGYSGEEIGKMRTEDFYPPGKQPFFRDFIPATLANFTGLETDLLTRDQRRIPHHLNMISTSYEGKPCLLVMCVDISGRRKAEDENSKLAMIANHTINAVVLTDAAGNIQWINNGFERMTGYALNEVLGQELVAFLGQPGAAREAIMYLENCMLNRKACKIEFICLNKAGHQYWVDCEMVPMRDSEGTVTGFMILQRDITDRKNAENELLYLNQDLKNQAADLVASNQELERFAYVASHDLQEPLRMVSSFMKLLRHNYQQLLDHKAQEYIHHAVDGADRMKKLIMDLLEYSRIGTNKHEFQAVDMNLVIQEVAGFFDKAGEENELHLSCPVLPVIYANKSQVVQLFQNLLGNALKYRGSSPPEIVIKCKEELNHFLFSVTDNGIGIDERNFSKIFILFQRLHSKEEYSGTGIGLATCKKIVELHGGSIWVESTPGKGSSFFFTIKKHS